MYILEILVDIFLSLYSHNTDGNTEITDSSQGLYPSLTVVGGAGAGPEHPVHLRHEVAPPAPPHPEPRPPRLACVSAPGGWIVH